MLKVVSFFQSFCPRWCFFAFVGVRTNDIFCQYAKTGTTWVIPDRQVLFL